MRALAQELIGLWGPWMSTDRNEKISNHEKDMFRDSFPSGEQDRTHSVSGVKKANISASLWCWEWRHISGHKAKDSSELEGKGRKEKVMLGAPWCGLCDSVSSFAERARSSKPKQDEQFQIPFKYLLPEGNFEKGGLGPHKSALVHIQISACRWRNHFLEPWNHEGTKPACFGLWNKGNISQCCSSPCCPDPLCQAALVSSSKPTWLSASLCLMTAAQNPVSEPLSSRGNCFNLIKWRWNLKWLNVYLLTGRNVL